VTESLIAHLEPTVLRMPTLAEPFFDCPLATRLKAVLVCVKAALPGVQVGEIEGISEGFPGARVVMPNGADVVVGVDLDQPSEFFEVVRIYEPGETAKLAFETSSANGFASTEKLTGESVLKLVERYASSGPASFTRLREAACSV
jgi:hypothetical protein